MPGRFPFPAGLSAGVRSCTPLSGPESFHDRGNFSRAPSAGAEEGGCLTADGAGGASRPCPWRGLYRVSPVFVELFGADGAFFTASGKIFSMEGKGGDGTGRGGTAWTHAMMRQRGQGAGVLPATCDGDRERTQKSPLSITAGCGGGRGEDAPAAPDAEGRARFRTPQRTDAFLMSVRCTLGCCGHTASCEAFCEILELLKVDVSKSQPQPAVKPSASPPAGGVACRLRKSQPQPAVKPSASQQY